MDTNRNTDGLLGSVSAFSVNLKLCLTLAGSNPDSSTGNITKPGSKTDKGKMTREKYYKYIEYVSVHSALSTNKSKIGPSNVVISEIAMIAKK